MKVLLEKFETTSLKCKLEMGEEMKETDLDFCPLEVLSHPLVWTEGGPFLHQHAAAAVTHLVAVAGGDVAFVGCHSVTS